MNFNDTNMSGIAGVGEGHAPQAFPVAETEHNYFNPGMTLRDYMAGQALIGLIIQGRGSTYTADARQSYKIADEMLKARAE